MKSTVAEIRARFDVDVDRFSNLETGQTSTVDAALSLELIAQSAAAQNPQATAVLDVGCGAGNYTCKLLQYLPQFDATLIDLSEPMLTRASERVGAINNGKVTAIQGDVRELDLGEAQFDVIMAAAVLHHLRTEAEWEGVFGQFHRALKVGGSLWVSDLVVHEMPAIQTLMYQRYGDYLTQLRDEDYRDHVFAYVAKEDSPRSVTFQLNLLQKVGFAQVDILHKNSCFAAFGAVK
jgi:tRNA (cmo5U34)-methyltransferase